MEPVRIKAGLIPYYKSKILVCLSSNPEFGGSSFALCKGNIDKGESPAHAALREAQEELGLKTKNIKIDTWDFVGVFDQATKNYKLHMFTVEVIDPIDFNPPSWEISVVKWMHPQEFLTIGRDINRPIVQAWIDRHYGV